MRKKCHFIAYFGDFSHFFDVNPHFSFIPSSLLLHRPFPGMPCRLSLSSFTSDIIRQSFSSFFDYLLFYLFMSRTRVIYVFVYLFHLWSKIKPPTLASHGQEPQELGNDRFHADKWLCPGCELGCIHVHTIAPDTAANIDK